MFLTYQTYLASLNIEDSKNQDTDWGQHYDMESQILINAFTPLKHPILNYSILNQINQIKQIKPQLYDIDIEIGLKKYIAKQSNNSQCNCKCSFITSLIYISHIVLFIMLLK
jgi:hypothetical protein